MLQSDGIGNQEIVFGKNRIEELCGEGNGNPLQYSCLENPMDGGAWWAAIYGTRLT